MQVTTDSQIKDFELRNAIKNENLDYLKNFIDEGGSVNGRLLNGLPLLSCAAFENSLNVASFLLDRGADINIKWSQDWTPLYFAVNHNQTDAVKLLLSRGAFVDARSQYGQTPLYFTIENKNLGIAKLLIDNGADVNVKWGRGKYITTTTPLYFAVTKNQSDLARLFLDSGADINASVGNSTPLLEAVEKRKLEMTKLLLDRGADVNNQARLLHHVLYDFHTGSQEEKLIKLEIEKSVNHTPLHYAAREGKLDLISRFLNKGDDINAKDKNGLTPLHYAALGDKLGAAKLLVEKGANIGAKTKDERTPFEVVYKGSQVKSFLSVKQSEYDNLLLAAVHNGDIGKVTDLLNKGANIEAKGTQNETPLCVASAMGGLDMIRLLLDKGANVNIQDDNGKTPLHNVAYTGQGVELILGKGANIEAKDKNGLTPLHYAAWGDKLGAAKLLVEKGANIGAKTKDERTPFEVVYKGSQVKSFLSVKQSEYDNLLLAAVHNGDIGKVTDLLNKGANIEAKGTQNETPLCVASAMGGLDMIRLLLDKGANVNIQDDNGKTPLHNVAYTGQGVELILGKGANIEAKDKNGLTPLHYAAWGDKLGAAKLLVEKGANIGAKTKDKRTLFEVVPKGSQVKSFLSVKQSEYDNLLLAAVHNGDIGKVTDLLNKGANINARDDYASTPLHCAAQEAKSDMVDLLLNRGADVNAKDYADVTPLHCAAWAGDIRIMEKFFNKGAVQSLDKDDNTPLRIAMRRNWPKSVINYLWGRSGNVSHYDRVYYTWNYHVRMYGSIMKYDLRHDRAPRAKREIYAFLAGQHTSLHDEAQGHVTSVTMTEPLLDGGATTIGAQSSDNDEVGYNKAKSRASKSSSLLDSIVNWIKGSTNSPALLTSKGHDSTAAAAVPEMNASLVNSTIILGILTAGLFNKTQYRQPIPDNLLSPLEQSMKLNNVDGERIKKDILQAAEKFGDPDTDMYEVEVSGNKTGMWK